MIEKNLTLTNGEQAPYYPGEQITPLQMFGVAEEYRKAALLLQDASVKDNPLSRVPCRLLALQAIELYLNAHLAAAGIDRKRLRGFQHDLVSRERLAKETGLVLRARTRSHIAGLTSSREYLLSRYAPELIASMAQLNRVVATMEELAKKVAAKLTLYAGV